MKSINEIRLDVLEAVNEHPRFRDHMLRNPHSVISDALGVSVPKSFEICVHEDAADLVHVVLPPDPALGLESLDEVVGGHWVFGNNHSHDNDNSWNGGDS